MTTTPTAPTTSLSRRAVLGAAATGAALAPLVVGASTPAAANTLPLVTPVWSERVRRSFGVAVHPNLGKTGYAYVDAWAGQVAAMNVSYIRGRYAPRLDATAATIARCRALGLKWLMLVIPEDWSMSHAELRSTLAHIRDNAADVCIGIEGMNEPNHNRDGSAVRPDWAAATVAYQKIIKDFVAATPSMAHVTVVGPSLQLGGADPLVDFQALTDAGIKPFMAEAGMHSYPGGLEPTNKLDQRLGWVRNYWGDFRYWGTETGYTSALNTTSGFRPVPEEVAAVYGPRSILTYFERGAMSTRFELLNDPEVGLRNQEAHFGLVRTPSLDPSTWSTKPEFDTVKAFQERLMDPVASYSPVPVRLKVTAPADVKWTVVQKSDGSSRILAYRDVSVYNVVTKTRLDPGAVAVTVTDREGTRVVGVGPNVRGIRVR